VTFRQRREVGTRSATRWRRPNSEDVKTLRAIAISCLVTKSATTKTCELCTAEDRSLRLHDDDVCWVALCETCDVPMVVWKAHGTDSSERERMYMARQLARIALSFLGGA
jgi:hypothetical protein